MRCPRCGAPAKGFHVNRAGDRVYIYAYHGRNQDGKVQRCYLGPSVYEYYARVKNFETVGLAEESLGEAIDMMKAIVERRISALRGAKPEERREELKLLQEELEYALEEVKNLIARLEKEKREVGEEEPLY